MLCTPPPTSPRGAGLLLAASATAVVAGTLGVVDAGELAASLRSTDVRLLLPAVGLQVLALVCLVNLYRTTHGAVRSLRATDGATDGTPDAGGATVGLAAFGLTQLLPGGGVAGGALAMRRFQQLGSGLLTAASAVVHIGLLSLTGLCLVVTVTIGLAATNSGRHAGAAAGGLALCGLLIAGFLALQRTGVYQRAQVLLLRQVESLLARRAGSSVLTVRGMVGEAGSAVPLLPVGLLLRPLTWSIGKWALDLTVLALVVRSVGASVSLAAIAVAYATVNLLNSLPLTPGGLGLVEGGLSASLLAAGLDLPTAATVTVVYRAVSYWLPLTASAPAVLHHLTAARVTVPGGPARRAEPEPRTLVTGPTPA